MLNRDWLKRFDVTEIVLPVGFAEAIFGGREATTGNASAVRRLLWNVPIEIFAISFIILDI